jgi:hypothetical protein
MVTQSRVDAATSGHAVRVDGSVPSKPIYWFAALGVVLLVVAAQGWLRWIFSTDFGQPIPTGSDHYPYLWYLRAFEAASVAATGYLCWRFLIKPWIRDGKVSFDGKLVIGMMIGYFWEPMVNFYNFTFAFNAYSISFGTWANYIPGFRYPGQEHLPDGLLYALPQYVYSGVLLSLIGAWWLRWSSAKLPRWSELGRWAGLFFLLALIWMPFEFFLIIVPQVWTYQSTVSSLSLFSGTIYQFPLYEGFIMALFGCGVTYLRVTRNDRGETFVEHGVEAISPRWRNKVSTLAVVGAVCLWTGVSYFGPWTWLQVQTDATAKNAPSYLRSGICGGGTDTACPGKFVPIPSRTSIRISPTDPALPAAARDAQGR